MGTRAMILFEGKPLVATHWDGYPESLGADLVKAKVKSPSQILRVAKKHNIDFASSSVIKKVQRPNMTGGNVITPEDYPVGSMNDYDDFAEFEYNVTADGKVTVRPLSGTWKESRHSKTPFKEVKLSKLKKVS